MNINIEEILAAIEEATAKNPDDDRAFSTSDLARVLGSSENKARNVIRTLLETGRAEPVTTTRMTMSGVAARRIAYRIVPPHGND